MRRQVLAAWALAVATFLISGWTSVQSNAVAPSPPWPRPTDTVERVAAARLGFLPNGHTTLAMHIHPHLTVYYDGQPVAVPAEIGIDAQKGMAYIHTHDATGILHAESPTPQDLTLGQFFTLWGVPLTGARAWVDGQEVQDPASIVLRDRTMIIVTFGTPPANLVPLIGP